MESSGKSVRESATGGARGGHAGTGRGGDTGGTKGRGRGGKGAGGGRGGKGGRGRGVKLVLVKVLQSLERVKWHNLKNYLDHLRRHLRKTNNVISSGN